MSPKFETAMKKAHEYKETNMNRHPQVVNDCFADVCSGKAGIVFNGAQLRELLFLLGYTNQAARAVSRMLLDDPSYSDDKVSIRYLDNYYFEVINNEK